MLSSLASTPALPHHLAKLDCGSLPAFGPLFSNASNQLTVYVQLSETIKETHNPVLRHSQSGSTAATFLRLLTCSVQQFDNLIRRISVTTLLSYSLRAG
jgi:hypothetical protein